MLDKISIIVPVYNTSKYLKKCIESLLKQSYKNIEIVLVDDGSTDNSYEICLSYAECDKRIKLISKKNGGLSDARNAGLDVITGEYIGFVDSDDYVSEDFYSNLYAVVKSENADISVARIEHVDEDEKVLRVRGVEKKITLNTYDAMQELLISKKISNSVCNKLFRREIIGDFRFIKGKLYEDEYFTYKIFHNANRIVLNDKGSYFYRSNPRSITHQVFSEREFDRIFASQEKIEFCERHYPALKKYAQRYLVYDCISSICKMNLYSKKYNEIVLKNIRRNLLCFMMGKNSLKAKLFSVVCAVSPKLAIYLLRVMKINFQL